MSTFTDDELGALLRETFHAQERADDADRAQRIASPAAYPVRRNRVPGLVAAMAAGIVVVGGIAGLATYAAHHVPGSSESSSTAAAGNAFTEGASRAGPDANRAAAAAEARRLIDTLSLPGAAARKGSAPVAALRSLGGGPIGEHPVTATGFWAIPDTTAAAVQAYLTAKPAAGMTTTTGTTSTHTPSTSWTALTVTVAARTGTAAYAPPELDIDLVQDGPDVAVRADAFLNWRTPRPTASIVTGTVTSATVIERPSADKGPHVIRRAITAPADVRRLERLVNGLPGLAPRGAHGCSLLRRPIGFTTVSLRTDQGTWRFHETLDCSDDVAVTRDGRPVGTIDHTGFVDGVAAIAR